MARYTEKAYSIENALHNIGKGFWLKYQARLEEYMKDQTKTKILDEIHDEWDTGDISPNGTNIRIEWAVAIYQHHDWERAKEIASGKTVRNTAIKNEAAYEQMTVTPAQNEYNFRLKWPAEYRCEDGHYVRSKNEMLVDNWLYSKGICHAYEKAIFSKDGMRSYCSDFYVPSKKLFIEIWGMIDSQYQERRKRKAEFYHKHGFELLEISGDDVKNLDDKLNAAFCAR